jgi:hypothetical protein
MRLLGGAILVVAQTGHLDVTAAIQVQRAGIVSNRRRPWSR